MPPTITILKNVFQEAVVKVAGADGTTTITLASLMLPNESPSVANIAAFTYTGVNNVRVEIIRDGLIIYTLQGSPGQVIDLLVTGVFVPDSINNNKDIDIVITGGQAELLLHLKKSEHWVNK